MSASIDLQGPSDSRTIEVSCDFTKSFTTDWMICFAKNASGTAACTGVASKIRMEVAHSARPAANTGHIAEEERPSSGAMRSTIRYCFGE
jgi:hypothetical protein